MVKKIPCPGRPNGHEVVRGLNGIYCLWCGRSFRLKSKSAMRVKPSVLKEAKK